MCPETPGDFDADTTVAGGDGRYRAVLSPRWEVWGPMGGYVAAVALRALAAEAGLPRPASFHCHFLSVARFAPVDLEVESLRRGKRAHALAVRMTQDGAPVLAASGWFVDGGLAGFVHDDVRMPDVPPPEALRSYAVLSENYDEWYPVWRTIDGHPARWSQEPGPPVWQTWMRLVRTPPLDPILQAARAAMWMDMMMWNAATPPHVPWPVQYLAPNLDLAVSFHASAEEDEWLLCDAHAPFAGGGLVGCTGRVWTASGRLVASGTSTLFCRPNPMAAPRG